MNFRLNKQTNSARQSHDAAEKPARVLHINSGNLYGGIETMLVTLARHRALCLEMEPHFALCFAGRLSDELKSVGAPVHLLGGVRVSRPATVWRARTALKELIRRERFDLVVCHAAWTQAIFGPAVRAARIPLVFWLHGVADRLHWLERWARRTPPDLAICNSHFTALSLPRLYPQARTEIVCCPVSLPKLQTSESERLALRAELDTPAGATVIIQVSRMEACKGHALHLEALSMLKDSSGWVCWQIGGSQRPREVEYENELKNTAERLGIGGRVRFLGQRADIPRLLVGADIYCQPNVGPESFGITFIEAMHTRLPVVTTAIGGAKEIVDDTCGVLVTPGDARALAASLRRMIEDSTLRARLAAGGPARARELCDPTNQIQRLNKILAGIANESGYQKTYQNFYSTQPS